MDYTPQRGDIVWLNFNPRSAENKPDDGRRSSFLLAYITAKSDFFSLVLLPVK